MAWSDATLEYLHDLSCEDPLTGLASLAHVRTRLDEIYREAELTDVGVAGSHALVIVELCFREPTGGRGPPLHAGAAPGPGDRGDPRRLLRRPDDRPARPGPGRGPGAAGPSTSARRWRCCGSSSTTSTSARSTYASGSRACPGRRRLRRRCSWTSSPLRPLAWPHVWPLRVQPRAGGPRRGVRDRQGRGRRDPRAGLQRRAHQAGVRRRRSGRRASTRTRPARPSASCAR